jgi:hypothetical protein
MPQRVTRTGLSPAWAAGSLILIILGVWMFIYRPSAHPVQLTFRVLLIVIGFFGLIMAAVSTIRTRDRSGGGAGAGAGGSAATSRSAGEIQSIARQILHQQRSLYAAPHEHTPANPDDFPDVDRVFYDSTQRELETLGFRFLDDVENVTLSRNMPALRTFSRTMTGDDDTIVARIYQLLPTGRGGRDIRAIELTTEFTDFTFMVTTNAEIQLDASNIRGIIITRLPPSTSASQLVQHHRSAVAAARSKTSSAVRCSTMDAIFNSIRRAHAVRAVHRKRNGYVTLDDLKLIRGEPLTELDQQIFEEINQLEADERVRASTAAASDVIEEDD